MDEQKKTALPEILASHRRALKPSLHCQPGTAVSGGLVGISASHPLNHLKRTPAMTRSENGLIRRLPQLARQSLLDRCEKVELALSTELSERGKPLQHAYFPRSGFISLVIDVDSHPALEVGMLGREGMLGAELILGDAPTPWRALVQGAGQGWRIDAQALREASMAIPALRQVLQMFLLVRLHQQALSAACERFHMVRPRLARWLLMSQDRAQADCFYVTQEFIALMLGVRRVGITTAAHAFQQNGLIAYHRGQLTVLDRVALEAQACSCYAVDKRIYATLMRTES